jgi:HK97 family phage portal protein
MGFLKTIRRLFERRIAITWDNFPGGYIPSGTSYNYAKYIKFGYKKNPIVYACIQEIQRASASIKIKIKQDGKVLEPDEITGDLVVLNDLINRPNKYQGQKEFLERWSMYMQLGGIAYIRGIGIGRDKFQPDRVKTAPQLRLIAPDRIKLKHNRVEVTEILLDDKEKLDPEEILWTLYPDPEDDFVGLPPMQAAHEVIDAHSSAITWNRNVLERGGVPMILMVIKGLTSMTQKQRDEMRESYEEQYGGAKNAGRPLIIPGEGIDAKQLSQTAQELDWLGGKQDLMRDVSGVFGVPSILLNDPNSRTYSNYKEARKSFYIEKILPDDWQLVTELNNWLIPKFEFTKPTEFVLVYDHIDVLRDDLDARTDRLAKSDWMSPNEKRVADGLDERDDPAFDEVYIPFNIVPLGEEPEDKEASSVPNLSLRFEKPLPHVSPLSLYPTEADRVYATQRFDKKRRTFETKWERLIKAFWREQIERVLMALKDFEATYSSTDILYSDATYTTSEYGVHIIPSDFVTNLFASDDENLKLTEAFTELQAGVVVEFGQDAIEELIKSGVLFEFDRPDLQNWLATDLAERSEKINRTTAKKLQGVINAGVKKNEGILKIKNRITDHYKDMAPWRARAIAQTEVGRAASKATLAGYEQISVEEKEWVSARDNDVRDAHIDLDGTVIKLGENFSSLAGGFGPAPGLMGEPADDINCRCVLAPLKSGEKKI